MFIAVPVEHKPSLKSPPWMTILLIVINVVIFLGVQAPEDRAVEKLADAYAESALPELEMPPFVAYLKQMAEKKGDEAHAKLAEEAERLLEKKEYDQLYVFMWQEHQFRRDLLADKVILPTHEQYTQWRSARATFNTREPSGFTTRWSQDYSLQDVGALVTRPITLLTSTFLHGSFGHLLGNMVFLFIFGFTLEKALGAGLYLACYLLAGIGASALAAWAYAGSGSYGLGASGAIAGLMGMYVVLYRLRRIKFFYYILFYFSYARLPALVMLPVWMGHELLQSYISDDNVAYMAHFGGLATGALLLALVGLVRPLQPPVTEEEEIAAAQPRDHGEVAGHIARAKSHADALDFEAASKAWRSAAKLRPADTGILQSWFEMARHFPASDDFHTSARMLFQLRARDEAAQQLQYNTYQTYLRLAQPGLKLRPPHVLQLARTCLALQQWDEAERLCRLLEKMAPTEAALPGVISQLVSAWARQGATAKAVAWYPVMQRLAPNDPVTAWLGKQMGL